MIKKICLLLSLIMVLTMFSACKSSNDDNVSSDPSSVSSEETPSDTTETPSEEPEEPEEETDGDYYEDGFIDDDYVYVNHLNVYNSEKPINERYGGMSGTIWHAFGFMKDDKSNRVYTDKMMDIELDRLESTGIHYCRTRYQSEWSWNPVKEEYDWNSKRFGYFCDYANALQDRGMEIVLSVGWHFGFVSHITDHSIDEIGYLNGEGEDKFGESVGLAMMA